VNYNELMVLIKLSLPVLVQVMKLQQQIIQSK